MKRLPQGAKVAQKMHEGLPSVIKVVAMAALEQAQKDGLGLVVVLFKASTGQLTTFRAGISHENAVEALTRAEREIK